MVIGVQFPNMIRRLAHENIQGLLFGKFPAMSGCVSSMFEPQRPKFGIWKWDTAAVSGHNRI